MTAQKLLLPILLTLFIGFYGVAYAQSSDKPFIKIVKPPSFDLPIDCRLEEDCWVMNYVDMGPDDGKLTDFNCLERTYDGHKGTDFAIEDEAAMKRGVAVLAAMEGTIMRVRDNEPDKWSSREELDQIQKERKECGNAVMIDHGDGLQSIYCHMKQGSVKVKPGDKVKSGDVIGQVGLSGFTQFPHLHFGVIWEGALMDPFTGVDNTKACTNFKRSMWNSELDVKYQPLVVQAAGFSNIVPTLPDLERNAKSQPTISASSDVFAFWGIMLGSRENDKIILEIKDPNGKIFARREVIQPKNRARQFYYTGKKLSGKSLAEGAYTGTITVERTDTEGQTRQWTKTKAILVTP